MQGNLSTGICCEDDIPLLQVRKQKHLWLRGQCLQKTLVQISSFRSGSHLGRGMSSGWLLSAISTRREKNRCMALNQDMKKQESEVSFKVIWAGVLVGSVSGLQLRTCNNCLAVWLFLQQSHLSVFMCKQRTLICPVFHACTFIQRRPLWT